jgi:glycosyltransferase involved in cell wall biosynthesis
LRICVNALAIEPGITGGGETFLVNLMNRLSSHDIRNQYLVLVTADNRHLFETNQPKLECRTVIATSHSRFLRLMFENFILPFYLLVHHVGLYYSPSGTLPPFLFCRSVVTIQNLIYFNFAENVPYRGKSRLDRIIVTLQGLYFRIIMPHSLRRADGIWAVSQTTAAEIANRFGVRPEKIDMIYEGVNFDEFNQNRRTDHVIPPIEPPYIVTVATMYPNKNIDKLIVAYSALVAKGFPHKLVIAGPDWIGYQEVLQRHVEILNLSRKVIFTGAIAHDKLPEYLWSADLFVLMSSVESFGLTVIEAMAAGVPVIISDTSSLPEIAGDAALTAPPRTPSRLAIEMMRVLNDRGLANQLRERGMNRARHFDWNETAVRAMDLFNRVGKQNNTNVKA